VDFVEQKKSCDYMTENNIQREVERRAAPSSGWNMEELNASEEDMDDWTSDVHWIGGTQELASNYGVLSSTSSTMTSAYGGQDDGVWFQDADGGQTWWERDADTGEYYTQDTYGVYWSWNDWEAAQQHASFTSCVRSLRRL